MRDFAYAAAKRPADVVIALSTPGTMIIAGGTELLNWLRLGIADPERLADIGRIKGLDDIESKGGRLSIGALATLNEVGEHPLVREHAAVLGQACLKAASAQIRNCATIGGNVLQKTRCAYFRSEAPLPWGCNKREPGSGCAALAGLNERHAILGWTDACVATHPADPPVALAALDAVAEIVGPKGRRSLPIADFHVTQEETRAENGAGRLRLASPAHEAQVETRLARDEMIVA
ncbi:MAG: FAD binding domain-containing protein [Thermoleophilaceae bacterium]